MSVGCLTDNLEDECALFLLNSSNGEALWDRGYRMVDFISAYQQSSNIETLSAVGGLKRFFESWVSLAPGTLPDFREQYPQATEPDLDPRRVGNRVASARVVREAHRLLSECMEERITQARIARFSGSSKAPTPPPIKPMPGKGCRPRGPPPKLSIPSAPVPPVAMPDTSVTPITSVKEMATSKGTVSTPSPGFAKINMPPAAVTPVTPKSTSVPLTPADLGLPNPPSVPVVPSSKALPSTPNMTDVTLQFQGGLLLAGADRAIARSRSLMPLSSGEIPSTPAEALPSDPLSEGGTAAAGTPMDITPATPAEALPSDPISEGGTAAAGTPTGTLE